jgi:subtilisin family serine protease
MLDPALEELLRNDAGRDEEVEAIIRLDRPDAEVVGARIVARFGSVATCRIRADAVPGVRRSRPVLSLKASRTVGEEREVAPGTAGNGRADERRPPELSLTGAGVLVGFCDWGCDPDHPNFKHPDGSTRLEALWDQRGPRSTGAPRPYGYGRVYGRREIDAALRTGDPYAALGYHPADADRNETGTHGCHVMDIAAGNGADGGPVGIAPEATLCFVHLADRGTGGLANLGDSARLLEACHFIAHTAGDRPWVINLSLGRCGGPHDDTLPVELALDHLLSAAPNRCICQSAGNYFDKCTHASGRLESGQVRSLTFRTQEGDLTPNELEVWYSGEDEFRVMLESPTGVRSQWIALGSQAELLQGERPVGRIYHRDCDPGNRANHLDLFLDPWAPAGPWILTLHALKASDGVFHAWLERDEACLECQASFDPSDADSLCTTGTIANGRLPLVVGAHDGHSAAREPAPFSSAGYTRDGRPKPELTAPGTNEPAARSAPRGSRRSPGGETVKSGTSMATPQVTGAAALCLQGAPRPLWAEEIRALLLSTAQRATPGPTPSPRSGWGRLDIAEAVGAISALERTGGTQPDDGRGRQ